LAEQGGRGEDRQRDALKGRLEYMTQNERGVEVRNGTKSFVGFVKSPQNLLPLTPEFSEELFILIPLNVAWR
jgi:hypothetical protein